MRRAIMPSSGPLPKNLPASALSVNDNTIGDHNNLVTGSGNTQIRLLTGHNPVGVGSCRAVT